MKNIILLVLLINGLLCAANDRQELCGRMLARSFNIDDVPHIPTYLKEISQALADNQDEKARGFLAALSKDPISYSQFLDHAQKEDDQTVLTFLRENNSTIDVDETEIEPLDL